MQYAVIDIDNTSRIIDAAEYSSLEAHVDGIVDGEAPDGSAFEVVYGAYIPQPEQANAEALQLAEMARGFWLGSVQGNVCHIVGLEDVKFFEPVRFGRSIRIPFAGLINIGAQALASIREDDERALTCFVRYREMSPATNILNRHGVFGIKAREQRHSGALSKTTWQEFIDRDRALHMAARVI